MPRPRRPGWIGVRTAAPIAEIDVLPAATTATIGAKTGASIAKIDVKTGATLPFGENHLRSPRSDRTPASRWEEASAEMTGCAGAAQLCSPGASWPLRATYSV